jgi:predicted Zn-dependent protease
VITWSFASGSGTSTSPISGSVQSQYQAVIERAIQTWAAATGLTFTQVPASAASDIQIGWGDFDTTSSGTVGYTSSAGDNAGQIQSVIVRLEDPAEDPLIAGIGGALTYSGTQTELYQVALHEIGHALGLAESSDPNSVMFPLLGPSNTSLDATDITDVDALYNPTAVAGGSASALLAQAMSSFGVSLPPATASFPISTQTTQPTLAASTMH